MTVGYKKDGTPSGKIYKKGNIPWTKGRILSKEHRKKISIANKGKIPWNKGIKMSDDFCKKCSIAKTGVKQSKEWIEKRRKKLIGKKRTIEARIKYSLLKMGEKNPMYGKKLTKSHIRKALRRRRMSSLEKRVDCVIKKYNLPYKFVGNGKFFIERKNPDFININGEKKVIEVYCRRHKENIRGISIDDWKDERSSLFKKYGWKIIFIEDWQTNDEDGLLNIISGG